MIAIGMMEYQQKHDKMLQMVLCIKYMGNISYIDLKENNDFYINAIRPHIESGFDTLPLKKCIKERISNNNIKHRYKIICVCENSVVQYSTDFNKNDFICDSVSKFTINGLSINEAFINNYISATKCLSPIYPTVLDYYENDLNNEYVRSVLDAENLSVFKDITDSVDVDELNDCMYPYKSLTRYLVLNDHEFLVLEADHILKEVYVVQNRDRDTVC